MRASFLAVALLTGGAFSLAAPAQTYTVRAGDTLYSISRAARSSVTDLMTLNGLDSPTVQVGQVLRLTAAPAPRTTRAPVVISPQLAASAGLPRAAVSTPAPVPTPTLDVSHIPSAPLGDEPLTPAFPDVESVTVVTETPEPAAPVPAPTTPITSGVLQRSLPPVSVAVPAPVLPKVDASAPVRGPRVWNQPVAVTHLGPSAGGGGLVQAASFTSGLPARAFLGGMSFARQSYNNCGPASVSHVLSYFGYRVPQEDLRKVLRPRGGYMRVDVIAPYVRKFGLTARVTKGGTLDGVKKLVSQGVPVIVLQWYDRPGHIPHFRVVRGYDDAAGIVWVSDSMVGGTSWLSYRDFDRLWNTQGRQMIGVYPTSLAPRG